MTDPRAYPGRCNAINSDGARCFVRMKGGGRCHLHRDHGRQTSQASGKVYRCTGTASDGAPCFVRVERKGDLCPLHGGA